MLRSLGTFSAIGAAFTLRASRPLAELLGTAFADLRDGTTARHHLTLRRSLTGQWRVALDGTVRYHGPDAGLALYDTLIAVNALAAAHGAANGPVLHGAAVEIDGRAVALVGHSGAGKSTLAALLVQHGCGFIADEVTAVDSDGRVRPFHRPIGLRADGARAIGVTVPSGPFATIFPWQVSAHGGRLSHGAPLALVLLVNRSDEAPTAIARLRPAEALYRLSGNTLGATGNEGRMFRHLEGLVRRVPVGVLTYSQRDEAVGAIRHWLATAP